MHGSDLCPNQNVLQFGLPAMQEQSRLFRCDRLEQLMHRLALGQRLPSLASIPPEHTIWKLVRNAYPEAALLAPRYDSSTFSNQDPFQLAAALEFAIRAADERDHYRDIILIGFSTGALIVRKAYLYGMGINHDHPALPNAQSDTAYRKPWAKKVSRIVFASGVSRGWDPDAKPEKMPLPTYLLNKLFLRLAELTDTAR